MPEKEGGWNGADDADMGSILPLAGDVRILPAKQYGCGLALEKVWMCESCVGNRLPSKLFGKWV